MNKTIDEVVAEACIRDIQMRYCRAVDRKDFDLLRTCFHADATLDYGLFSCGADEFIALAEESLKAYLVTTHFTGNQLVEVKGDSAWAEHYTVATHRCPPDDTLPLHDFVTAIRYVDTVERRDGDWRIGRRVLALDWWRKDPVPEAGEGPGVQPGKRDRGDASYAPA